ncbi:MAG: N-acetylmuramoyl-L-alanine amidase [Gammaproteobacteria bacterium]
MTLLIRLLPGLIFICIAPSLWAQSVQVKNIRIWSAPDSTRVVFDVSATVNYQTSMLADPYRLVIDIEDADAVSALTQPLARDRYLQRLRAARRNEDDLRIVIDLKKYSRTRSFQLKPNRNYGHRLVVDVFDTEAEQQAQAELLETDRPLDKMRDLVIAIDAGHGGEDPGARGPHGTLEKTVVLQVARRLKKLIDNERGMHAVLIRKGDYFLRLRKRIKKARKYKADMFVSIHADAFRDPDVHGSSVYILSKKGASSEQARWLAEQENASDLIGGVSLEDKDDVLASVLLDLSQTASLEASIDVAERVLDGLKQVGAAHKRKVQAAGFAVLKSPDIPSILVETAYISNPIEERNLRNPGHQAKVARAILKGLRAYFYDHAPEGTILAARKHVISYGDTLSTIAQRYQVSLQSLRNMNGIKGDLLQVGQVLTIPAGSGG